MARLQIIFFLLVFCGNPLVSSFVIGNRDEDSKGIFWQITDIHWDVNYSQDGDPSLMCHMPPSDSKEEVRSFGRPRREASPAHNNGAYGSYLCDSPWTLVEASLDAMKELYDEPNFILWTGDMSPHVSDPEPEWPSIFSSLNNVTQEMKKKFTRDDGTVVPILPVLGNHDTFPKDFFPDCPHQFFTEYLVKGGWSSVLSDEQQQTFTRGGYYLHPLADDNLVVVLNTNMYYMGNKLGVGDPDPCGQFKWLENVLKQARVNGSKVILSAHSPPGFFERMPIVPFLNDTYNNAYLSLVSSYGDVVHSHVYGHLHTDSFRIFGANDSDSESVAFLAPSLTPWTPSMVFGGTAVNPSLRLYNYDKESVLNYIQYYLNLTKANQEVINNANLTLLNMHSEEETVVHSRELKSFESNIDDSHDRNSSKHLKWEILYETRSAYGLERLDAPNMNLLLTKLRENETLFGEYYLRNSAGFDNGECNETCKNRQLCAVSNLELKGLLKCLMYNFTEYKNVLSCSMGPEYAEEYAYNTYSKAMGNASLTVESNFTDEETTDKTSSDPKETTEMISTDANDTTDINSIDSEGSKETASIDSKETTNMTSSNPKETTSTTSSNPKETTSTTSSLLIDSIVSTDVTSGKGVESSTVHSSTTSFTNFSKPDTSTAPIDSDEGSRYQYSAHSLPVYMMVIVALCLWVLVGVLFIVLRWRRRSRQMAAKEEPSFSSLLSDRTGGFNYVSLPDDDGSDE